VLLLESALRCENVVGDAIAVMHTRPDTFDWLLTSPPYNLGKDYGERSDMATLDDYLDWTVDWIKAAAVCLKAGGRLMLNLPIDINLQFDALGKKRSSKVPLRYLIQSIIEDHERCGLPLIYNTEIVWLERNVSRRTAWGSWCSYTDPWVNTAAEVVLVYSKGDRKIAKSAPPDIDPESFMRDTLGIWDFPGESPKRVGHPAPFPEELARRLLRLFTAPGSLGIDPFVGSGTTPAVALKLGRRCVGVDLNPEFIALATERCERALALPTARSADGVTYEQEPMPV
jgi:site-specific DNA-methyltransferase (adenine-specific)